MVFERFLPNSPVKLETSAKPFEILLLSRPIFILRLVTPVCELCVYTRRWADPLAEISTRATGISASASHINTTTTL